MAKTVKFSGPNKLIKLNFRSLATPMVGWEGTAKELHDHIINAWLNQEPVGAAPAQTTEGAEQ